MDGSIAPTQHRRIANLWAAYRKLRPGPRQVLWLKSLLAAPVAKTAFGDCLMRSGVRTEQGRPWVYAGINSALVELGNAGLLTGQLTCVPELLHEVAIDAMASPDGPAMANAVRRAYPPSPAVFYPGARHDDRAVELLARLELYTNDGDRFTALRTMLDAQPVPYQATDLLARIFAERWPDDAWVHSRHPAIQLALVETRLRLFHATGAAILDPAPIVAHYRGLRDDARFAGLATQLAQHDIITGRIAEASAAVAALADGPARLALQGELEFLAGRNDAALAAFRAALKLRRKQAGTRKLFLEGMPGLCCLLALLRANDTALHTEMQAALDIVQTGPVRHSAGFAAMQVLLWLAQGVEGKARAMLEATRKAVHGPANADLAEPLSVACLALAEFALDADGLRRRRGELAVRFDALKNTMPLVARIHAELLAALGGPSSYQDYLTATGDGWGIAFTDIVRSRPAWERALQSLENFLDGAAPPEGAAPRREKRLVWFVDPLRLTVDVAEQTAKGADGWTEGRAIALKRLHERDPRINYLTDHDLRALRSIRRTTEWGADLFSIDSDAALPALVGHPLVFNVRERGRRLELMAYPPELVVSERGRGYHVALSHTSDEPTVFLEAETPSRYRVIEFPRRLLAVQEIISTDGLTVPAAARDQLIALVKRDNPTLPIRSELAETGLAVQPGDPAPVVQCVPEEAGLRLVLLVRPFGAEGPAFVAGLGGRSVLGTIAGETRRATRDLTREVAERNALVAACPTLRDRGGSDVHELAIDDLEGSLDLLLELQAYAAAGGALTIEWPEGKTLRVSKLAAGMMKLRVGQERDWFSIDGSIATDDDQVLDMRFLLERLGRAQGRFVQLEDGRFIALTRQLQAQLQRLKAVSEPTKNGRRVHALGAAALAGVLDGVTDEAGTVTADAAWKKHIARIGKAEGFSPVLPATLQAELRDYQVEGFAWMSRLARWGAGACLADDMGLGKTVQTIAVLLDRADGGPTLVVAPTSVGPNWEAEIARFAPSLTAHRFAAAPDRAAMIAAMGPRDVLVCSYGLLHQAAEALGDKPWHTVVLDEAQAIKNAQTKRAQASLGLQAGFRIALTGTPVENDLDELWSLFSFVNSGLLGSRESFQKRFAGPIERDRGTPDSQAARQALRALIRPFLLRRTKAAVLSELPPRTEQTMAVEMSDSERHFYEALRQRAVEAIAAMDAPKGQKRIQILAEIMRLRRACCNPALIDAAAGIPSGKLAAFLELVDDLTRNRHQALVFSQFVGHLKLVREALDARKIRYEYLDGSTPAAERDRAVKAFQGGSADFFLISLRAGGTGLNLTAADYVVHLDPWWNPAVEDQASDRAHRIGQERPVTIYRLVMQNSIEERILALHRDKRDLAADLLDGGDAAGRLSEEELLDLIRG